MENDFNNIENDSTNSRNEKKELESMTEKRYKEVIFEWVDSGGEYHHERRIVTDKEKGDDGNE